MRAWISSRLNGPSPSMLVAVAALVVALGGTAVAASTVVNIADPTAPAHVAKVDATGALHTAGTSTVSGYVGETAPKTPFFNQAFLPGVGSTTLIAASKSTITLTRVSVDNYYAQVNAKHVHFVLQETGGNGTSCDGSSGTREIGEYDLAPAQAFTDAMESPVVLKPFVANTVWCLTVTVDLEGGTSSGYYLPSIAWSGYVVAGTPPAGLSAPAAQDAASATPPRAAR
jgi:hypothetical protein